MRKTIVLLCSCFLMMNAETRAQQPSAGTIRHFEKFTSSLVAARNVDVWLPPGYSSQKKYAVLYMHDGQMLFDSTQSWNKQEWKVDETISQLIKQKQIRECIVVAVYNSGAGRHADYCPQKPVESLPAAAIDSLYNAKRSGGADVFNGNRVHSDDYLRFLVTELKPFIDSSFSVYTNRSNTYICGSSMGGLISLYALCEYPDVFGGAACLSTHWPGIFTMNNNPLPDAFFSYVEKHLPDPATHKIYFDYGNKTLDSLYPPLQQKVDRLMKTKGYNSSNWTTRFFAGADHSERSWAERFSIPILFLLGNQQRKSTIKPNH